MSGFTKAVLAPVFHEKANAEYSDLCGQRHQLYVDVVTNPVAVFVGTRDEILLEEIRLEGVFKEVSDDLDVQIKTLQADRLKEFQDLLWKEYGTDLSQEQHDLLVRRANTYNYDRLETTYVDLYNFINQFNRRNKC